MGTVIKWPDELQIECVQQQEIKKAEMEKNHNEDKRERLLLCVV